MDEYRNPGMGWWRDNPDFRDLTAESDGIAKLLSQHRTLKTKAVTLATSVDLRAWCSPIENQASLGACTAHAGVGLLEYFERRAHGTYIDASRLFLYKTTRNLLHWTGDTGAFLRTTMKAMVLFGIPPEEYWQYDIPKFDVEPSAFLYSYAESYKAIQYYRLDPPATSHPQILTNVKTYIAAGLPCMFGFTVYSSIPWGSGAGDIPYPKTGDKVIGGHAVDAVGYDDARKIGPDTGALLIRNSWGTGWGDGGYGWLPYKYVLKRMASDFWSLLKAEYIPTSIFG